VEVGGNQNTKVEGKTSDPHFQLENSWSCVFSQWPYFVVSVTALWRCLWGEGGRHLSADEGSARGLFLIAVRRNVGCEAWSVGN